MNTDAKEKIIYRLKAKLKNAYSDEYLNMIIEEGEEWILAYTNRTALPDGLIKALTDLVVITLNREGTEGEQSRSEGGESYNFEVAPRQIYDVLNNYRLLRVGGKAYESKTE